MLIFVISYGLYFDRFSFFIRLVKTTAKLNRRTIKNFENLKDTAKISLTLCRIMRSLLSIKSSQMLMKVTI